MMQRKLIKQLALQSGFDAVGIVPYMEVDQANLSFLQSWIQRRQFQDMEFMTRNLEIRTAQKKIIPDAKSIIIVLKKYGTKQARKSETYNISKYARIKDYHVVMKKQLKDLLKKTKDTCPGLNGRVFSDTAPIMEKLHAMRAGLGWIGKNTLLIHPDLGSFCFIGEIITDSESDQYDKPLETDCGSCSACVEACPLNAIEKPYQLDTRKCVAYYTIEHKGSIPKVFAKNWPNFIYGCDICQEVCPYNHKSDYVRKDFSPVKDFDSITEEEWEALDETKFFEMFCQTPVARIGFDRLMRNIQYVRTSKHQKNNNLF